MKTVWVLLSDSEHLGPAYGTYTLGRWPLILHNYASGVPHLSLCPALYTITLHLSTSFSSMYEG